MLTLLSFSLLCALELHFGDLLLSRRATNELHQLIAATNGLNLIHEPFVLAARPFLVTEEAVNLLESRLASLERLAPLFIPDDNRSPRQSARHHPYLPRRHSNGTHPMAITPTNCSSWEWPILGV